jgi:hypothetical protein
MTEIVTGRYYGDLSWLADFQQLFGGDVDLLLELRTDEAEAPSFEYGEHLPKPRSIVVRQGMESGDEWRSALRGHMQGADWKTCVANAIGLPQRSLRCEIDGVRFIDAAAFVADILKNAAADRLVVVLAPLSLVVADAETHATWREWIATHHRVEGIVYLGGPAAELIGAHPQFGLVLLLIRSGPTMPGALLLSRLLDLRGCLRTEWAKISSLAMERQGGEAKSMIVLRTPVFNFKPWTYERFSKQFQAVREDASRIGTLRPLSDFVADIRGGLHRAFDRERLRELNDSESPRDGYCHCFGGQSIRPDGRLGSPVCEARSEGLPPESRLRAGDVLVRSIINLRQDRSSVLAAVVTEDQLPATFDRTCLRIRFRDDVHSDVTELIAGYLNSSHTREWLTANGVQLSLNADTLRRLEVPDPSEELRQALQTLADAESQYRRWGDEVAETRRGLFVTASIATRLPILLARKRIEIDRLQAARDADSLDHRIRNYYPHPIALRWELARQTDQGRPRIEAVMDCAEHLITLLAVIALLQEPSDGTVTPAMVRLRSFYRDKALHMDWGKCFSLLQDGARFTATQANPLALRFPELAEMDEVMRDSTSEWSIAEKALRDQRNKQAHLQCVPETEMNALSDECLAMLNRLLNAASFISAVRLVYVRDYRFCQITSKRFACSQLLQGISPVFRQQEIEVRSELPRGAVGFLNRQGEFASALPWLDLELCQLCKRPEVFVFNRLERGHATYVAMETGHPLEEARLAKHVAALVEGQRSQEDVPSDGA